jgi:putative ABC transport system ATP-binding protein
MPLSPPRGAGSASSNGKDFPGPTSDLPVVEVEDLRFGWPGAAQPLLQIESLRLMAGERLFLQGESGSGKSTLLSLLAGVLLPQAGRVSLLGTDGSALKASRRDRLRADHVGLVFQQFNLLGYLPVIDNVLLPCRFSPRRAARAAASDGSPALAAARLLARMGLDEALWPRPASRLSVGQQQRVAAARALIGAPELLIADEPTSALDESRRDDFMALLLEACTEAGSALVFVSHDARLAAAFPRRVVLAELNRAAGLAGGERP